MNTPYLTIGSMRFALQGEITDGWEGKISAAGEASQIGKTHPTAWLYKGGRFHDLTFQLHLFVDGGQAATELSISTPDALLEVVRQLVSFALPARAGVNGGQEPPAVRIGIGSWYSREGYLKSVLPTWLGPWTEDGKPMQAKVTVVFIPSFSVGVRNDAAAAARLPTASSFAWRMP